MLSRLLFACASVLQDCSNLFSLKVKKIKLCQDLRRNQKVYKIRNEIQNFLLRSLKKSFFGQK